ncbi:MAG TPA: hypothetical protein VGR19_05750 [Allosphingosinicella sp.]|nr:hypothetical protein [Allosphingosinicella sp.]
MKKMFAVPLLAFAAACAPVEPAQLADAAQSELTTALRGRTPGQPVSCVAQHNLRGSRSAGQGVILFEGRGDLVYVNRPPAGCPALDGSRTIVTRTPANQLCRGDTVTVIDLPSGTHYGACGLGDFTPYRRSR